MEAIAFYLIAGAFAFLLLLVCGAVSGDRAGRR